MHFIDLTNDSSDDEGNKQPPARVIPAAAAASSSYVKKETKPSVVLVTKNMLSQTFVYTTLISYENSVRNIQ